jgi:hypothetical protein
LGRRPAPASDIGKESSPSISPFVLKRGQNDQLEGFRVNVNKILSEK